MEARDVGRDLEPQGSERHGDDGPHAVNVQAEVVVVGVEVLLHGVKFDGEDLVGAVAIVGGVREAEKLAVAVGRGGGGRRGDKEGDALAGSIVFGTIHVYQKGSVERDGLFVEAVFVVPESEGGVEEDSAGAVGQGHVACAVWCYLERFKVDGGAGQHRERVEVRLVEGAENVVFCVENLGLGSRRREQEEDGGDDGDGGGVSTHVVALEGNHEEACLFVSFCLSNTIFSA